VELDIHHGRAGRLDARRRRMLGTALREILSVRVESR
jgi:hypothetical protein